MEEPSLIAVDAVSELDLLRRRVREKTREVGELRRSIADIECSLATFMLQYRQRVGVLELELERINLTINEFGFRLNWFGVKRTVIGMEERLNVKFQEQRQHLHDAEGSLGSNGQEGKTERPVAATTESEAAVIRALYRTLAKRLHPDLSNSEEDRIRRHELMVAVNGAHERGDVHALEWVDIITLDMQADGLSGPDEQEMLEQLRVTEARLDEMLVHLRNHLASLKEGPEFQLKLQVEVAATEGRNLLDELAAQLRAEIKLSGIALDALRESCKTFYTSEEASEWRTV